MAKIYSIVLVKNIYISNNTELPRLVQFQPERFKFMTQRARLPNAGFIDA